MTTQVTSVADTDRIESLDVLRGFALLGILMLNILGFGLLSSGYFNPEVGIGVTPTDAKVNLAVWAGTELLFEGSMRCLFSLLFGAGVVLFTAKAREHKMVLHYRRNFWLLVFGLIDAYILLWYGDILITYALAGMLLYPLRKLHPMKLTITALVLVLLMSIMNSFFSYGLDLSRGVASTQTTDTEASGGHVPSEAWEDFIADYRLSDEAVARELELRQSSYTTAFEYNSVAMIETLTFVIPIIMLWDSFAMMLLGMAFFKWHLLDASRPTMFYTKLALFGFALGLSVNFYEIFLVYKHEFDPLVVHSYMRPSYHIGRLGMALGYLGLVMLMCQRSLWQGLIAKLAAVGRMALTNYLLHSLICLFLFTGAGLALVGQLQRWQLYPIVLAIWILQLYLSQWWMARFRFGPLEWLWRILTYGSIPAMRR